MKLHVEIKHLNHRPYLLIVTDGYSKAIWLNPDKDLFKQRNNIIKNLQKY